MSTCTSMGRSRCHRSGIRLSGVARCVASAAALLAGLTAPAGAAQINYGTFMGTHVIYTNITEDTGASEPLPLFGPPTVTGDSIDFNPVGFDAASTNIGSDITSS